MSLTFITIIRIYFDRSYRSHDFHPEVGLVIAGGNNGTVMDRVEISPVGNELGAAFEELAPLPKQLTASCLAILSESTVFVAGGLDIGELDFSSDLVRFRFTWIMLHCSAVHQLIGWDFSGNKVLKVHTIKLCLQADGLLGTLDCFVALNEINLLS